MPGIRIKDATARAMIVKWAVLEGKGELKLLKEAIAEYLLSPLGADLDELSDLNDQKFSPLREGIEGRWDPPNLVEQALGGQPREPEFRPAHTYTYTGDELRLATWHIERELMDKLSAQAKSENLTPDELAAKTMRVYDLRRQQAEQ